MNSCATFLQIKMAILWTSLMMLSLYATVNATQLTIIKSGREFYVETDNRHFSAGGKQKVAVVDGDGHVQLSANCDVSRKSPINWLNPSGDNKDNLQEYYKIRGKLYDEIRANIGSRDTYDWSDSFSAKKKEYSLHRLPDDSSVFSSSYFPAKLARVVIGNDLVIFVGYDGRVLVKPNKCLLKNEQILISGVKKINREEKTFCLFPNCKPDKALKKYLQANPFDEIEFYKEQEFV